MIPKEDDEVIFAISSTVGSLYPVHTKRFQPIVGLLENLCQFEETMVRDSACASMVSIVDKLTEEDTVSGIIPAVLRLADAPSFTAKVSALNIISAIYEKCGDHKAALRK